MSVCAGAVYKLVDLKNLFIEMTSKNCNMRCKSCYIDFKTNKIVKDFISVETVKGYLKQSLNLNLHCIYLTGAEPMMHPDFNAILRLCLKRYNVCICTNGSFLNEKKIRFLKKVEDEGENQIFFRLSLIHYDELKNDSEKYRGNYRQTLYALKVLSRYGFISVLSVQNFYNINPKELRMNFEQIFSAQGILNTDIQITESFSERETVITDLKNVKTDCMYGRVVSENGVYSCPFLANDYRGRCGISLDNYSETILAETNFCVTCAKNKNPIFSVG